MKQKQRQISVSIIGARAYPSQFVGTSGIEVYVEKVLAELLNNDQFNFNIYTKSKYQLAVSDTVPRIISLPTIYTKVFESMIYSFLASVCTLFDASSAVWYHGTGPAIFSWIPRLAGKKIIITVHSLDWQRDKWNLLEKTLFYSLSKKVLTNNQYVTGVSESVVSSIKQHTLVTPHLTPPGILLEKGPASLRPLQKIGLEKYTYLLYLGRFVPEKRIEWLIECFLKLKKKWPWLKLVVAGGHGNLPEYEKILRQRHPHNDIIWPGYLFDVTKNSFLSYSLGVILPSKLEGFPVSIVESLSLNTPCVIAKGILSENLRQLSQIHEFEKNSFENFCITVEKMVRNHRRITAHQASSNIIKISRQLSWKKTALVFRNLFADQ